MEGVVKAAPGASHHDVSEEVNHTTDVHDSAFLDTSQDVDTAPGRGTASTSFTTQAASRQPYQDKTMEAAFYGTPNRAKGIEGPERYGRYIGEMGPNCRTMGIEIRRDGH